MRQTMIASAIGVALLFAAGQAKADTFGTFDLRWSGDALGNGASATGTITLDLTVLNANNPGAPEQDTTPFVAAFSITVSGASLGNGTFGFADFNGAISAGGFRLDTGGGTLDFSTQLVDQPVLGGFWASTQDGSTGDFNIFNNGTDPAAPLGTSFFSLTTEGGSGDTMILTSFAPASSVPEPSSVILISTMLLGIGFSARKRMARVNG